MNTVDNFIASADYVVAEIYDAQPNYGEDFLNKVVTLDALVSTIRSLGATYDKNVVINDILASISDVLAEKPIDFDVDSYILVLISSKLSALLT